ncbi:hypothetical protein XENOCAPTIV_011137 [Xenoophorus captivus]|uniref:Uncharacterized protein n=1 Tax=Xenoophorus captivus TaxID=1517983 RepID=A0ABV0SEL4_9TELE
MFFTNILQIEAVSCQPAGTAQLRLSALCLTAQPCTNVYLVRNWFPPCSLRPNPASFFRLALNPPNILRSQWVNCVCSSPKRLKQSGDAEQRWGSLYFHRSKHFISRVKLYI